MQVWNPLIWLHLARYYWTVSRGYRFRPWQSPYLLWRIETNWGVPADQIRPGQFFTLLRKDLSALVRFGAWTRDMRRYL